MQNRGEQDRHRIAISFGRQRRQTELASAGRLRLMSWGIVIRGLVLAHAPGANVYSQQPFTKQRVDFDTVHRISQLQERYTEAIEVDEWLQPLREKQPAAYAATEIRYIRRGHNGGKLDMAEQLRYFYRATKLGRQTYYNHLDRVLQHICAEILLKENPELK